MDSQLQSKLSKWLLENGGPSIRYRTATELMGSKAATDVAVLARDLIKSPLVVRWLEHLKTVRAIHGSRNWELENPVGKLTDLVSCHSSNVGYSLLSLILASSVVNCQLTFARS